MIPTLIPEPELQARARAVWEASGMTQWEMADALGVSQPALSNALNKPALSLTALRVRVIERYGGARVSGPLYQLDPAD